MSAVRFQSTLPRGERLGSFSGPSNYLYFNPRSREGSDFERFCHLRGRRQISIHAPARGATALVKAHSLKLFDFNPRSREGSDHITPGRKMPFMNFNPRSREGSDPVFERTIIWQKLFQSTLPRGERLIESDTVPFEISFQSTLPRGERRRLSVCLTASDYISIHAPARGATDMLFVRFVHKEHFNPRSREGSDIP